jgi:hypothetical protein
MVLVHDWDLMARGELPGWKGCRCAPRVCCHGLRGEHEMEWRQRAALEDARADWEGVRVPV